MTERPTDYDSLVAAVRKVKDEFTEAANDAGHSHPYRAHAIHAADRLAALLPPAKERVPWPAAFGRMINGWEVTNVTRSTRHPSGCAITSIGEHFADPDGMVEVDAL